MHFFVALYMYGGKVHAWNRRLSSQSHTQTALSLCLAMVSYPDCSKWSHSQTALLEDLHVKQKINSARLSSKLYVHVHVYTCT